MGLKRIIDKKENDKKKEQHAKLITVEDRLYAIEVALNLR